MESDGWGWELWGRGEDEVSWKLRRKQSCETCFSYFYWGSHFPSLFFFYKENVFKNTNEPNIGKLENIFVCTEHILNVHSLSLPWFGHYFVGKWVSGNTTEIYG